jgi:hypothetical protein
MSCPGLETDSESSSSAALTAAENRASLLPKWPYTRSLFTPAWAAMRSIRAPSIPNAANSRRAAANSFRLVSSASRTMAMSRAPSNQLVVALLRATADLLLKLRLKSHNVSLFAGTSASCSLTTN